MARHLELGKRGEEAAVRYLKRLHYRIVSRNYRCRYGEVDIIALDRGTIVFVEVKTRSTDEYGSPEGSVTIRKQRQLGRTALSYLQSSSLMDRDARFDVVAVDFGAGGEHITIIKNAFEMPPW
ncbi:MAG TPA: YraN family protein [Thermodesulfobacteriota bacterium]|nr:YraN family protein [Deltaproteobacteria bacterium]HNR14210.1 YraN family protein [Thermodesulfobacteriota bacterium]HNU71646.1 YraN family protein [Thermodesulfobacteriota bacterium]HOC39136.1 YraN family protein [Thermodesulfobacteriota bacterium]